MDEVDHHERDLADLREARAQILELTRRVRVLEAALLAARIRIARLLSH